MEEVRKWRVQCKGAENQLKLVTESVNKREKELQLFAAENAQLKKMAGKLESWGLDPKALDLPHDRELQKVVADNTFLEHRITNLEVH